MNTVRKVLVIDDDFIVANIMRTLLETFGNYECLFVPPGPGMVNRSFNAIENNTFHEMVSRHNFQPKPSVKIEDIDLVILDYVLDNNTYCMDIARMLSTNFPNTKWIIWTGSPERFMRNMKPQDKDISSRMFSKGDYMGFKLITLIDVLSESDGNIENKAIKIEVERRLARSEKPIGQRIIERKVDLRAIEAMK